MKHTNITFGETITLGKVVLGLEPFFAAAGKEADSILDRWTAHNFKVSRQESGTQTLQHLQFSTSVIYVCVCVCVLSSAAMRLSVLLCKN